MPELTVKGTATITAIDDAPEITTGEGHVVTGRFITHDIENLIQLTLSDDTTIDVTSIHPIWSVTRQDWIQAGDLQPGEELDAVDGAMYVKSIVPLGAHPAV